LREHCAFEHPLQPFSPRAFGEAGDDSSNPRYFSYRGEWRIDAQDAAPTAPPPFVRAPLPERTDASGGMLGAMRDDMRDDVLEASPTRDALQAFFANPAKRWLKTRLGLRLPERDAALEEREPLGDDALQRHLMVRALLRDDGALAQDDDDAHARNELQRDLRARGVLAPGRDGERVLEDALPLTRALRRAVRETVAHANTGVDASAAMPIEFAFHDVWRDADGAFLRAQSEAGKLDGKRRLRAWLDHLLLASVHGTHARTVLIGEGEARSSSKRETNGDERPVDIVVFGGLNNDDACARLRRLLALQHEGMQTPLPFAPKAAWVYIEALRNRSDTRIAWREARDAFASEFGGEARDPYFALAFRPESLFDAYDSPRARRFREIASELFGDMPESNANGSRTPDAASGDAKAAKPARARKKPSEPAA
jgi:exodeoxyribonuclease V gamma subunit